MNTNHCCEYELHCNNIILFVQMEYFQDDLFCDTLVTWKSGLGAKEWLGGANGSLSTISLRPEGMKLCKQEYIVKYSHDYNVYKGWVKVSCILKVSAAAFVISNQLKSQKSSCIQCSGCVFSRQSYALHYFIMSLNTTLRIFPQLLQLMGRSCYTFYIIISLLIFLQ